MRKKRTEILLLFFIFGFGFLLTGCSNAGDGGKTEETVTEDMSGVIVFDNPTVVSDYEFSYTNHDGSAVWHVTGEYLMVSFRLNELASGKWYATSVLIDGQPIRYYLRDGEGKLLNDTAEYYVPFLTEEGTASELTMKIPVPPAKEGTEYNMKLNITENFKDNGYSRHFLGNGTFTLQYDVTVEGEYEPEYRKTDCRWDEIPESVKDAYEMFYGEAALEERNFAILADKEGLEKNVIVPEDGKIELQLRLLGTDNEEYHVFLFVNDILAEIDGETAWMVINKEGQMAVWDFILEGTDFKAGDTFYMLVEPSKPYDKTWKGLRSEPVITNEVTIGAEQ